MLAPLQMSYKSHQTARNNVWNWKNLEFVKSQKWSKLKNFTSWDRKSVHPLRFWEGKTRATRGYGRRLGFPLSYSWTQGTLLRQTQKCGYYHLYGAKLAFFDILLFIVKFLKLLLLWYFRWPLKVKYRLFEAFRAL